mmetsp:Transcript_14914/g.50441  ORF Transcript_14914/g.50441 Transcript_14914/m.50441 type:complete len:260 (+) Transcript_14914:302-1081(+)
MGCSCAGTISPASAVGAGGTAASASPSGAGDPASGAAVPSSSGLGEAGPERPIEGRRAVFAKGSCTADARKGRSTVGVGAGAGSGAASGSGAGGGASSSSSAWSTYPAERSSCAYAMLSRSSRMSMGRGCSPVVWFAFTSPRLFMSPLSSTTQMLATASRALTAAWKTLLTGLLVATLRVMSDARRTTALTHSSTSRLRSPDLARMTDVRRRAVACDTLPPWLMAIWRMGESLASLSSRVVMIHEATASMTSSPEQPMR